MSDLVKRLRTAPVDNRPATLLNEAADRIEELEVEINKLYRVITELETKK